MRGTINKSPVLNALSARSLLKELYEGGMVPVKEDPWAAFYPDALAWIDVSAFGFTSNVNVQNIISRNRDRC